MEQIDEKSLTICSGIDYTNIHYQHVVCADAQTAKVTILIKNRRNSKICCSCLHTLNYLVEHNVNINRSRIGKLVCEKSRTTRKLRTFAQQSS